MTKLGLLCPSWCAGPPSARATSTPCPPFVPALRDLAASGVALGDVLSDSGYAHRVAEHWALPLWGAGAQIVTDLHPHDRGPPKKRDKIPGLALLTSRAPSGTSYCACRLIGATPGAVARTGGYERRRVQVGGTGHVSYRAADAIPLSPVTGFPVRLETGQVLAQVARCGASSWLPHRGALNGPTCKPHAPSEDGARQRNERRAPFVPLR